MKTDSFRKAVRWLAGVAISALGAVSSYQLAFHLPKLQIVEAQVHAEPFFLERTIYTRNSGGILSPSRREILARRSDGTTARLQSVGPVDLNRFLNKIVFVDGTSTTFIDSINAKITWPQLSVKEVSALRGRLALAPKDCGIGSQYKLLRFDKLQGIEVVVIQRVIPGKYRVTKWLAPSLGCEDLYYFSEALNTDGTFSLSAEARLSRFILGEPDAQWFKSRDEFTEVKPSEAQRALQKNLGLKLTAEEAQQADVEGQLADIEYQKRAR